MLFNGSYIWSIELDERFINNKEKKIIHCNPINFSSFGKFKSSIQSYGFDLFGSERENNACTRNFRSKCIFIDDFNQI